MRAPLLVPLAALVLAGCAGAPAAQTFPLASTEGTEAPLEPFEGEFLLATSVPMDGPCPATGAVLSPAPEPGAWVEWSLPAGTTSVDLQLDGPSGALDGIGFRLCAFDGDALVGEANGLAPLRLEAATSGGTLRVLVAADSLADMSVSAGAKVPWTLSATALLSAAEGPA